MIFWRPKYGQFSFKKKSLETGNKNRFRDVTVFDNTAVLGRRLSFLVHSKWCVNGILTALTFRRFSHTKSSPMLHTFPFAFSDLGLFFFIKHSSVTDENHVVFNLRDLWDNFDTEEASICNE